MALLTNTAKSPSSAVIRSLAAQLTSSDAVWVGRGRKPINETRPALIPELCRITSLSRSVIHRALIAADRAGRPSRIGSRAELRLLNMSPNVSGATKRTNASSVAPLTGASTYQTLPIANNNVMSNPARAAYPDSLPTPTATSLGAKGLDAIGLRMVNSPPLKKPESSNAKNARQALEDGIDWFLSVGQPSPKLREQLLLVQRMLMPSG